MNNRALRLLWIFGGYTVLGLFLAAANSLTYLSTGNPANWILSIKRSLAEWYAWAALTPLILHLATRWPLERGRLLSSTAIHVGAMLVVGITKLLADQYVRKWMFGRTGYLLLSTLAFNFLIYCIIVAAAHGLRYYRSGRQRELRASQLEARLAETRLQLLSMQLQPHFLFNTLNAIAELVHEEPDTADRMISGLSELLRETLTTGMSSAAIDLRRELQLLDCYVDIQRARFGSRLQFTVNADARALDATVPALFLQPLVENAIRHGLSRRADAGRIEVSARRAGDRVLLTVRDDGPGMAGGAEEHEGVGLANTRARLQALFGSASMLDVTNAPQGGALVSIAIPYRSADAV